MQYEERNSTQVSIGIERLFSIMETNLAKQQKPIRTVDTQAS